LLSRLHYLLWSHPAKVVIVHSETLAATPNTHHEEIIATFARIVAMEKVSKQSRMTAKQIVYLLHLPRIARDGGVLIVGTLLQLVRHTRDAITTTMFVVGIENSHRPGVGAFFNRAIDLHLPILIVAQETSNKPLQQ
jgi:hypothetical protein